MATSELHIMLSQDCVVPGKGDSYHFWRAHTVVDQDISSDRPLKLRTVSWIGSASEMIRKARSARRSQAVVRKHQVETHIMDIPVNMEKSRLPGKEVHLTSRHDAHP